jgi:aminoglycoside phosphotransferase (APT) family kinase protein
MQPAEGFNATVALPEPHASRPDWRGAMGEALVDGIVALSRVDVAAVGLGDLGKSENWLERQVPRWRAQLNGYAAHVEWPGIGALPPIDSEVHLARASIEWPAQHIPGSDMKDPQDLAGRNKRDHVVAVPAILSFAGDGVF